MVCTRPAQISMSEPKLGPLYSAQNLKDRLLAKVWTTRNYAMCKNMSRRRKRKKMESRKREKEKSLPSAISTVKDPHNPADFSRGLGLPAISSGHVALNK